MDEHASFKKSNFGGAWDERDGLDLVTATN